MAQAVDCGPDVDNWLSQALNQSGLKLLKYENRPECQSSLANDSPFLLINRNSAASLHRYLNGENLAELSDQSVDEFLPRFRANFIIDGADQYEEDEWENIQIDSLLFKTTGQCSRCQMICVNQKTGDRNQQPFTALVGLRGKRAPFGVHLQLTAPIASAITSCCTSERPVLRIGAPVHPKFNPK